MLMRKPAATAQLTASAHADSIFIQPAFGSWPALIFL
jgi:hypothetical protein